MPCLDGDKVALQYQVCLCVIGHACHNMWQWQLKTQVAFQKWGVTWWTHRGNDDDNNNGHHCSYDNQNPKWQDAFSKMQCNMKDPTRVIARMITSTPLYVEESEYSEITDTHAEVWSIMIAMVLVMTEVMRMVIHIDMYAQACVLICMHIHMHGSTSACYSRGRRDDGNRK